MQFHTLHTNRLILRRLDPEAMDFIHQQLSDDEKMVVLGLDGMEALEVEKENYRKGLSTYQKSFCYFQLIDKNTQKIIGWCGYHTWYVKHRRAEIGYSLYEDQHKQKGLMSEALYSILEYGFEVMDLHRVEAFIAPYNIPSVKLIQKFSFVEEGLLREHYLFNGNLEDSAVFSLLKPDWEEG